ncbi:MAG: hypothetical protein V3V67_02420 [Myxococcota bacterium]
MSAPARLFPNLGAEEGRGWRRALSLPKVRDIIGWWSALFDRRATIVGVSDRVASRLPEELAPDADRAAFDFLEGSGALVPWLSTDEAAEFARAEGFELACAPAQVVRSVHDKAFAQRVAEREGLVPADLAGAIEIIEPELLRGGEAALRRLGAVAGRGFVLKPRLGSSGRGRVRVDGHEVEGALERLAARGGCLLEPWLSRTEDLSAQMWVDPGGEIRLLGTLRQEVTPSGVWSAHAGVVDPRGSIRSGSRYDEALRDAAYRVARAAREAGFFGVCGLDAFAYRQPGGDEALRPVVEFNARFTVGTIATGLVQRALRCGTIRHSAEFRFSGARGLETDPGTVGR